MNQTDHDMIGSTSWNDADDLSNINLNNFLSYTLNLINVGTFNEEPFEDLNSDGSWNDGEFFIDIDLDGEWSNDSTYNVLQKQWEISIYHEKLESVINYFIYSEELSHTNENGLVDMSNCTHNNCFGDYLFFD